MKRLYESHSRGLLAYASSILNSFAAAEDMVHQVFERLLRGDLEVEGSVISYLYRAVRNASLNQIRNRAREVEIERIDDGWLEGPPGMSGIALELQSALKELPEEQREIIALHVWGELSFDVIGVALGISPNTAASRYRYGLSKLRSQFQMSPKKQLASNSRAVKSN